MAGNGQEIEAKFYVQDLKRLEARLRRLKARRVQSRVLEMNIRFDLPDGRFSSEGRVLRLRRDTEARLTYKGASKKEEGILNREEIEFVVDNFEKARQFLEALGYQKSVFYEKYRTTYELDKTLIMLDEMPYGSFIEIEGSDTQSIRSAADRLDLNWSAAVATSYVGLFERVRKALKLSFADLSFADFAEINVEAADLGVRAADE